MSDAKQVVVFKLREAEYGFPIEQVSEIIKYVSTSQIPNESDYVEGIVNIRGQIHSIVNLRNLLGMDKKNVDNNTKIIIADDINVGFIVDDVKMIITPKEKDIVNSIPNFIDNNYILYIIRTDEGLTSVLNMPDILNLIYADETK